MKLFDKIKNWFDPVQKDKRKATKRGEPWVKVLKIDLDPENPGSGYFELDWNEAFVVQLKQSGYTGATDEDIVNKWFNDLCQGIASEVLEDQKFVADAEKLPKRRVVK